MKEFLKKFGLPMGIGLTVIISIVLIIIAFVRPSSSIKKRDESIYLHIQFETNEDRIIMNISANKEVDLSFEYTIDNVKTNAIVKILSIETEEGKEFFSGDYSFERKQELYIVKNLILKYNDEELYSRENITIPVLRDTDLNYPVDFTALTGKIIVDELNRIQMAFYKEMEILSSYDYIVECDDKRVEDNSVIFRNGIIELSKFSFKTGAHKLHIVAAEGNNVGEFSYTFNVSNELYIKNPQIEIHEEYYQGINQVKVDFYITGVENIIESLTINGTTYSEFEYIIDNENSRIVYSVLVDIDPNLEKPLIRLENISHKYGDCNVDIVREVQLKEINFETKIEYSNSVFFEGDNKEIEITIGNPEQIQVIGIVLNERLYECDSRDEIIHIHIISSAEIVSDQVTEIRYMVYGNMFSKKMQIENKSEVLPKVKEWHYNVHILMGNPIFLLVTLDRNISEAQVSFSGWVNLEEFNSQITPYEIADNVIKIDFSEYTNSPRELSILFTGINIAYGNKSYSIAIKDEVRLYYSDLVYNIYNFIYYDEDYKLCFNAQTFNNTQIKRIIYKLYDENENLIRDVSEPSIVYAEENCEYITYYILSIPSEAKYIEVMSIDCVSEEGPIQITQWLLKGQKQEIQKNSIVSE